MASRKKPTDASLPFAALQLLAPPVRLVSAALWKVLTQRDVTQYGVVEEFVTSACETVPGLLSLRHQGKLALGLRARFILELCSTRPDVTVIETHLKRIRHPVRPSHSSASAAKTDAKIAGAVQSFHDLVHTLLTDPDEHKKYFEEEFPVEFGPTFDQELEKLLWEFLMRLDQLLPVPTLSQTVSWLSSAPPVLEECARAATQPQLLKILLQHQNCLGHLEPAASLPPNMGDSVLASLSLPPSGRVPSNRPVEPTGLRSTPSNSVPSPTKSQLLTPVIGLISNYDVPVLMSTAKQKHTDHEPGSSEQETNGFLDERADFQFTAVKEKLLRDNEGKEQRQEEMNASESCKRKQPDRGERVSDKEGEDKRLNQLQLPEDPTLRSIYISCINQQPIVLLPKMSVTARGEKPVQSRKGTSPVKGSSHRKLDSLDDKENLPVVLTLRSSSFEQRSHTETLTPAADGDDYVADSEDEATKNFKRRLFLKRYRRTKHGTYVPTLREFWKPGSVQHNLLSLHSKRKR